MSDVEQNAHGDPIDGRWGTRDDDRVDGDRRVDVENLRAQRRIVAAALGGEAAELGITSVGDSAVDASETSVEDLIILPDSDESSVIDLRSDSVEGAVSVPHEKVRHYSSPARSTDEVKTQTGMPTMSGDEGSELGDGNSPSPFLTTSKSAPTTDAAVASEAQATLSLSPLQTSPPASLEPPAVSSGPPDVLAELEPPEIPPSIVEDRSRVLGGRVPESAPESRVRGRSGNVLLIVALLLALLSGLLGAMWMRERSNANDLRAELSTAEPAVVATNPAKVQELQDEVNTLQLENDRLQNEVDASLELLPDVEPGRISDIDIRFSPAYVDEVRGRFIAVSATGEYVVWGAGVNEEITDSGKLGGLPQGMFAARDQVWVATDEGQIEVLSLAGGVDGSPIDSGQITTLVRDSRAFWGFIPQANELQRFRQANGRVTSTIPLPTPIRDLTVGAGAVWALGEDGLVYRVNTADFTVAPLIAGQEVVSIAAGPDALWALSAADGSLRRLDAVSGEVLVTVPVGRDPIDAVFSGNSVWVALRSGSTLIEVDTRTSAVVSRTTLPGVPLELSRGATGVLVTLEGDSQLVRVASLSSEDPLSSEADDGAEG